MEKHAESADVTASSPRRVALLAAITECMSRAGLANLSLREIARQIGVSAPALIHHFHDKETLLREALSAINAQELDLLNRAFRGNGVSAALETLWEHHSTPSQRQRQAAAMEIQSIVQNDPSRFPHYHQHLSRPWIAAMHDALERTGCPPELRISLATLMTASYRGLLADLLATGESKRLQSAFHLLLQSARELEAAWRVG